MTSPALVVLPVLVVGVIVWLIRRDLQVTRAREALAREGTRCTAEVTAIRVLSTGTRHSRDWVLEVTLRDGPHAGQRCTFEELVPQARAAVAQPGCVVHVIAAPPRCMLDWAAMGAGDGR